MFVDPRLIISLAMTTALGGCVAPEEPPSPRPAAALPSPAANQANYEAAPIPNRQVKGPSTSVIITDINKPKTQ